MSESSQEENLPLAATVVWNLEDLYTGIRDPRLEEDMARVEDLAQELAEQYRDRVAGLEAGQLRGLVEQLEGFDILLGRLSTFAFLNFITRTGNAVASALVQQIEELASQVGARTVFFELEWNRLPKERAAELLKSGELAKYRHYLSAMRKFAPHQLSGAEEQLLREIAPVGRSAWLMLFEKLMAGIKFGERQRTEEEVLSDLYHAAQAVRKRAAAEMTAGLRDNMRILAHIFNTMAADKMIIDRLRGYESWLGKRNLENELSGQTVETLIEAVTARYDIVHRYYGLKRQMLGLERLHDYDRYAPVPGLDETVVSWERCEQVVLGAFTEFSPLMGEIAERFFRERWIHAPVQQGKRGGAFAHPCVPEVHPYIMVNYTGNLRDVSTVAHELGHGIHQYLAAEQGYYNSDTPLVLAETASVFGELLVFKAQLALLDSPETRRAFICQKLESIFATVFRQISMNRFEHLMHTARREQGELAPETLSALWLETQEPMFGDSVTLTEDYSIWWSYIPHFLATPGYVYSYAFGELLVLALYARYREEGAPFVEKYLDLLRAGGSETPYALLRPFNIDLDDPAFWHGGLDVIAGMLDDIA